ncbi:unnamed protein product, partial [marine sediment metagenome]
LLAARKAATTANNKLSDNTNSRHRCRAAEIVLLLADLLNNPYINTPAEALTALENFEIRFADCPDSIGPALRERILAHRQLKQLPEARQVVQQYLAKSPETAGPVMAKLLETMHNEINAAADRDDSHTVNSIATEAHQLAKTLLDWSGQHPEQVSATDLLTIRVWWAWSLLNAGQPADALKVYGACQPTSQDLLPANAALHIEISLGKAKSLLTLEQADKALPIFMAIWQKLPEHSPNWWRALVGSLESHTRLNNDPNHILQSIR